MGFAGRQRTCLAALHPAKARHFEAFAPASETLRTERNAWWAREDSNLQPDRYERVLIRGKSPQMLMNLMRTDDVCSRSVQVIYWRNVGSMNLAVGGWRLAADARILLQVPNSKRDRHSPYKNIHIAMMPFSAR